jgi:hypothetical protein
MEGSAGQWRIGILGPIELRGPVQLDLATLADQGKVTLHASRHPLEAANDAVDDLRHGRDPRPNRPHPRLTRGDPGW